jgi:hypothetical protein
MTRARGDWFPPAGIPGRNAATGPVPRDGETPPPRPEFTGLERFHSGKWRRQGKRFAVPPERPLRRKINH